jgi:hypothetical protein
MEKAFCFVDELGPFKMVEICRPSVGLKAVVAIDNIACGSCETWIPAARPDVIHVGNVARLQTRFVAEGPIPIDGESRAGARCPGCTRVV